METEGGTEVVFDKVDDENDKILIGEKRWESINKLSHLEMAESIRFAPLGHPYFQGNPYKVFMKRFNKLGGWTPEISKEVDW